MNPSAETVFQVPFHDVDMVEVVWHGNYYKYFELARTELFRKYDFDVSAIREAGYAMVVVESSCRYIYPLTYGMWVRATATLVELQYRLKINYVLYEQTSGRRMAKGSTTQVTLSGPTRELLMVTPEPVVQAFGGPLPQET